jgi:hypothetical protein
MIRRRRLNHLIDDVEPRSIVESYLVFAENEREWNETPESKTGAWCVLVEDDGSVVANRLLGVPVVGQLLGAATARVDRS